MTVKKIMNKILIPYRKIIKEIFGDYTTVQVSMGEKFCCYCRQEYDLEIEVPFIEDKLGAKVFLDKMTNKLKKYNLPTNYSSELLSFLHEIGHIKTYNKINDFTYCFIAPIIPKVQEVLFKNSLIMTKLCYYIYFNLALERKADKWAMEFIQANQDKVKQWDKMLSKNYKKVFEKVLTD